MSAPITHRFVRGDGPNKKVDDLIRKYKAANNPSPVLLEILNGPDNYSILVGAIRRQISLAKCRSQDFEDCQVTVYDRALLILSNYGESATDPSALELYLTEFLGVVPIAPIADGKETVSKHVELHDALGRAVGAAHERREYKREQEELSALDIHDEYERYFPNTHTHHSEQDDAKFTAESERNEHEHEHELNVRVVRLLDVYQQAKEDYFGTKEKDGVDSLIAVRFLRDSAENTLRYLRANGLSNHSWVPDLEQNFAIARDKTAQLLGGRKRHFDEEQKGRRRVRKRPRRVIDSYRPPNEGGDH